MAIVAVPVPEGLREIAAEALSLRLGRAQLDGVTGPVGLTMGLPRYLAGGDGKPGLDTIRLVAWDFFAVGEDGVALASVTGNDDDPRFAGVSAGEIPGRMLAAAALAEGGLAEAEARYRPMIVAAPDVGILSLIFRSDEAPSQRVDLADGTANPPPLALETGLAPLFERIETLRRNARDSAAAQWPSDTGT